MTIRNSVALLNRLELVAPFTWPFTSPLTTPADATFFNTPPVFQFTTSDRTSTQRPFLFRYTPTSPGKIASGLMSPTDANALIAAGSVLVSLAADIASITASLTWYDFN